MVGVIGGIGLVLGAVLMYRLNKKAKQREHAANPEVMMTQTASAKKTSSRYGKMLYVFDAAVIVSSMMKYFYMVKKMLQRQANLNESKPH
ncbi:MAG: hypothetical protein HWD59_08710 [Coxiellaceae bacterium]|nr:MAG: hypothetical protein HWD59_08710 [Coxiellaceae bacterium]